MAPIPIPASNAIYIVAIALPIWVGVAKSVVHAVKVGELNPHEIPKSTPEVITVSEFNGKTIINIEAIKKKEEIKSTGIRPY